LYPKKELVSNTWYGSWSDEYGENDDPRYTIKDSSADGLIRGVTLW